MWTRIDKFVKLFMLPSSVRMERDDLRNQVGEATSELSKLEALLSTRERERDALMEQYRIASHDAESFEVCLRPHGDNARKPMKRAVGRDLRGYFIRLPLISLCGVFAYSSYVRK